MQRKYPCGLGVCIAHWAYLYDWGKLWRHQLIPGYSGGYYHFDQNANYIESGLKGKLYRCGHLPRAHELGLFGRCMGFMGMDWMLGVTMNGNASIQCQAMGIMVRSTEQLEAELHGEANKAYS